MCNKNPTQVPQILKTQAKWKQLVKAVCGTRTAAWRFIKKIPRNGFCDMRRLAVHSTPPGGFWEIPEIRRKPKRKQQAKHHDQQSYPKIIESV